jgi:hypothetical protein
MIIRTYCKDICLEDYEFIDFEFENSMIAFIEGDVSEELYFGNRNMAMQFYFELIEAIHENREEIDLSHYMTAYSSLFIISAQELISERIKNFKSDEND